MRDAVPSEIRALCGLYRYAPGHLPGELAAARDGAAGGILSRGRGNLSPLSPVPFEKTAAGIGPCLGRFPPPFFRAGECKISMNDWHAAMGERAIPLGKENCRSCAFRRRGRENPFPKTCIFRAQKAVLRGFPGPDGIPGAGWGNPTGREKWRGKPCSSESRGRRMRGAFPHFRR